MRNAGSAAVETYILWHGNSTPYISRANAADAHSRHLTHSALLSARYLAFAIKSMLPSHITLYALRATGLRTALRSFKTGAASRRAPLHC